MMFKKKSIEIDALLFNKQPSHKTPQTSNILSVKSKLKNLAVEETQANQGDMTPSFFENEDSANIELFTEIEKKIYLWLDEKNIIVANPKEKLYSYFQKNRDKILMGRSKKTVMPIMEQKQESKPFLNFQNSPLLMRREKKVNFSSLGEREWRKWRKWQKLTFIINLFVNILS